MPPVGFEPTISAGERPQTYALDRAATGTGTGCVIIIVFPLQPLLQERASMFRYKHIGSSVWYDGMQDLFFGLLTLGVYVFHL